MKFTPGIGFGAMSGSVGGTTISRNRSGQYARRRAVPVNTNTSRQVVSRGRFTAGVINWFDLTAAQRDAWNTYAANVPVTDALGQSINISGQNMFIRTRAAMLAAGLTPVAAAPTIFNLGDTDPTLTITGADVSDDDIDITFDDTLAWASEDGAAMLISQGRPFSVTRSFFNGPFRVLTTLLGASGVPITSPQTIATVSALGFTLSAGNSERLKARIIRADGRVSSEFNSNTFTITA